MIRSCDFPDPPDKLLACWSYSNAVRSPHISMNSKTVAEILKKNNKPKPQINAYNKEGREGLFWYKFSQKSSKLIAWGVRKMGCNSKCLPASCWRQQSMPGFRKAARCQLQTAYLSAPENCLLCRQTEIVWCGYKCHDREKREARGEGMCLQRQRWQNAAEPPSRWWSPTAQGKELLGCSGSGRSGLCKPEREIPAGVRFISRWKRRGGGLARICKSVLLCACSGWELASLTEFKCSGAATQERSQ